MEFNDDPFNVTITQLQPKEEQKQQGLSASLGFIKGVVGNVVGSFPSKEAKKYAKYVIYYIKGEMCMVYYIQYELRQAIYWQSLIELGLMAATLILLLFHGQFMMFLHLTHAIRPYFGLNLVKNFPRSHELIDELPEDLGSAGEQAQIAIRRVFDRTKDSLAIYVGITGVALILDAICILVDLAVASNDNVYGLFYFILAVVFIGFDAYLILWYFSMQFNVPDEMWEKQKEFVQKGIGQIKGMVQGMAGPGRERMLEP